MSLQPNAVSIFAMVCMVKLCLPVNHFDISDSLLWSFWAMFFWHSGKALSEQSILYHHSGLDKLPMSLLFVAP